jgi:hypothetical protein
MSKKGTQTKPGIPSKLVAFVHGTTDVAVRTAKSRKYPKLERYEETEKNISNYLVELKRNQKEDNK